MWKIALSLWDTLSKRLNEFLAPVGAMFVGILGTAWITGTQLELPVHGPDPSGHLLVLIGGLGMVSCLYSTVRNMSLTKFLGYIIPKVRRSPTLKERVEAEERGK